MFAALYVDGEAVTPAEDTPETVTVELNSDGGVTHRCRACGDDLTATVDGYEDESGESRCPDSDCDDGPHDPERVPLSWCNSTGVHIDPSGDAVTVLISVGDPRGAFAFVVRRVPDDVANDLAGRLIMHVPYPGEALPHQELTRLADGTYVVGPV